MALTLNPYLSFRDNAREAMEFYAGVLGADLTVSTFGEYGGQPADGFTLMGADTPEGMEFTPGTNISISLSGDEAEKLRGWFAGLAEGGMVTVPLEKQMWGDEFGMLVDRFGIGWMVNIAGTAAG